MNWTKVREFYGLKKPFNFSVAIPFFLSIFLFTGILLTAVFLFWNGSLRIGTALFYFLCYIACLLLIAAIFSRAIRLSYVILCWCTIELSLGLGSLIMAKHSLGTSLCPRDQSIINPWFEAFIYHPLLQTVPRPNWRFTDYIDFKWDRGKATGAGIDVASLQGQKHDYFHNSLGLRGKELTTGDLAKDLIFVYGGSTTYDIGVTQGETWVEHLQSELKNKYTVVNFGIPGHSSAEHLIQTAFYQDIVKKKPVCAVYYVGWNDIASSHIDHLDSAYADYHLLLDAERRHPLSLAKYSPMFFLINQLAVGRFDTVPLHPKLLGKAPVPGPDEHLEAIFIEHIRTIAAINKTRGIKTVFIGQILNRTWPAEPPDDYEPLVKQGEEIPLTERLKSILRDTAASIGTKYIDPGITNFGGNDFVDDGHFGVPGAKKFAMLVSKEIGDYCR